MLITREEHVYISPPAILFQTNQWSPRRYWWNNGHNYLFYVVKLSFCIILLYLIMLPIHPIIFQRTVACFCQTEFSWKLLLFSWMKVFTSTMKMASMWTCKFWRVAIDVERVEKFQFVNILKSNYNGQLWPCS